MRTVAGEFTSSTFYDGVRVPATNLVGEENAGWKLITNQLNHERVAICPVSGILRSIAEVDAWARNEEGADGARVIDRQWVQIHLARLLARAEFLKLLNWKVAWSADKGLNPADASATKVFGTEFALEAYRLLLEIVGQAGYLARGLAGSRPQGPPRTKLPEPDHLHLRGRDQRGPAGHRRHGRVWACPGLLRLTSRIDRCCLYAGGAGPTCPPREGAHRGRSTRSSPESGAWPTKRGDSRSSTWATDSRRTRPSG